MAEQMEQQEALHLKRDIGIDHDPQTVEDACLGRVAIAILGGDVGRIGSGEAATPRTSPSHTSTTEFSPWWWASKA